MKMPPPIATKFTKLVLTILAITILGIILSFVSQDHTLLMLSAGVAVAGGVKIIDYYRTIKGEHYEGIEDLIYCGNPATLPLWTMDEQALGKHPAIRNSRTARSIVLWRSTMPREKWTLDELLAAGVVDEGQYTKLSRCLIAPAGADDAPE